MRVKFCGITRIEDAREAVRLGAWAIGLNHWEQSPRRCDPATAVEISAELRRKVEIVGVFVNATLDDLARASEDESLTMIQLHGDEGPAFCREAARRTGCKVIKALRVRSAADIQAAEAFRTDYHLLDAHRPETPRGHRRELRLGAGRAPPLRGAGDPRRGPDARTTSPRRSRSRSPSPSTSPAGSRPAPGIKDHALMAAFARNAGLAAPRPRVAAR